MIRDRMEGKYVKYEVMERIGRNENGVRPIKILVEENAHRRQILAKAEQLKALKDWEKIYIMPDLTRVQQEDDKKLRDQVKAFREKGIEGVKIVKGEFVKGDGTDRTVLFKLEN